MTSFLSPLELATMRFEQDKTLLDETCTILRATLGKNAIGESVQTWGTVATGVPCRLRPSGRAPNAQEVAGENITVGPWTLSLPHGTAVVPGQRVAVGSATYDVVQSWDEETWKTASEVELLRVETLA